MSEKSKDAIFELFQGACTGPTLSADKLTSVLVQSGMIEQDVKASLVTFGASTDGEVVWKDFLEWIFDRDKSTQNEAPPPEAPLLLREISGHKHVSIPGEDEPGEAIMEQPVLVRGLTGNDRGTNQKLAELVATALKDKWVGVDIDTIDVKDCSGHGGSKTYKVSAEGFEPVALHSRNEECASDELSDPRMEAAAQIFSEHGLAPRRLAHGGDWFIEPWEGSGRPKFDSDEKAREFGQLVAKMHSIPTDWFDPWRAKLCDRFAKDFPAVAAAGEGLDSVPHGSHVWFFSCRKAWISNADPQRRAKWFQCQFFAPATEVGRRLVTTHNDLHPGNMLQLDTGMRCIDFEFSLVTHAIADLGYSMPHLGDVARKRLFLEAYLKASGFPSEASDVDALYLDALIAGLGFHYGPMSVFKLNDEWDLDFEMYKRAADIMRAEPSAVLNVEDFKDWANSIPEIRDLRRSIDRKHGRCEEGWPVTLRACEEGPQNVCFDTNWDGTVAVGGSDDRWKSRLVLGLGRSGTLILVYHSDSRALRFRTEGLSITGFGAPASPLEVASGWLQCVHVGRGLSWEESRLKAEEMGGMLPTQAELKEASVAMPDCFDCWHPVRRSDNGKNDWVQLGNSSHARYESHSDDCGGLPQWGENSGFPGEPNFWRLTYLYVLSTGKCDVPGESKGPPSTAAGPFQLVLAADATWGLAAVKKYEAEGVAMLGMGPAKEAVSWIFDGGVLRDNASDMVLALGNPAGIVDEAVAWKAQVAVQLAPHMSHTNSSVSAAAKEIVDQIRLELPWVGPILDKAAGGQADRNHAIGKSGLDGKWHLKKEHSSNQDLGSYLALQFPMIISGPSLPPGSFPTFRNFRMTSESTFIADFDHPDVRPWNKRYAIGELLDGAAFPDACPEPLSDGLISAERLSVKASAELAPGEIAANLLLDAESHDIGEFCTSKWNAIGCEHWIEINVSDAPVTLKRYAFKSGNDCPGRDPRCWKFIGIQADGTEHVLHTAADIGPLPGRWVWREFLLKDCENEPQAFKKFRIDIAENNGDPCTQLGQIRLYSHAGKSLPEASKEAVIHQKALKLFFPIDSTVYVYSYEQKNESPPCMDGKWCLAKGSKVGAFGSSFIISVPHAVAGVDAVDPFEELHGLTQVQNEIFGYWRRGAERRMTQDTRGLWKALLHNDGKLEVTVFPVSEPTFFFRQ